MSVTINAHQLKLLLDQTVDHIGSEHIEALHGIRLDVDAHYLYAVATDRYSLAVARYALNHADEDQTPWAVTVPGDFVPSLRQWINSLKGAAYITISTANDRLVFDGPLTGLNTAINAGIEFLDWRGLLRNMIENSVDSEPFPALNSKMLANFNAANMLRVRLTGNEKPVLLFGQDFIGAQMPARYAGIYPAKDETFATAHQAWSWTLSAGSTDANTDGPAYQEERSRYEVTTDTRETGEALLRQTLQSGWDMHGKSRTAPDEFHAHVAAAVNGWMAFRYLDALHNVDPRAAAGIVAEVAEELDSGEIGEFAWDASEKAGFDPQKWHDDYEAFKRKLTEKAAAEESAA